MKMIIREVFPTLFYEFDFSVQDQIAPLVEEIQDKKNEIKKYGEDDYWTDYTNPIKLLEYEKLIDKISFEFLPKMMCTHIEHWTAIYGERGYHMTHNHIKNLYDSPECNMSSILYLSDIGYTEFFNPRLSADEIHFSLDQPSIVGKMIMFPSHILHHAMAHKQEEKERIIVSSNWQVYKPTSIDEKEAMLQEKHGKWEL